MRRKLKVGEIGELDHGQMKRIFIEDEDEDEEAVALINLDGHYFAISDTCTHEAASLSEGKILGDVVECPHHGARFDLKTGAALSLPAVRPVKTYPVVIEGLDIFIELEE
ncbi:MAG: non-heme iron oxygenase ferredoxin subunit [Candidatus Tectomicrobia bacterium]|uniref:Non-heme iron oxygenase ferredoxin subunit n=1 Tax=Tectimicrobiota bacterium TaxID=2528274 RepID=A0A933LQR1_UNCTE|nr:non-heme iron oxygenase ferredoxin subunit [Candidatus Tectomicrobia bacterium]